MSLNVRRLRCISPRLFEYVPKTRLGKILIFKKILQNVDLKTTFQKKNDTLKGKMAIISS